MKRGGRIKTKRPTAEERRVEEHARLTVWARASRETGVGWCEVCGEREATEYQHRKARKHCTPVELWAPSNGLAVCGHGNYAGCHGERIHQQPLDAWHKGWTVRSFQDPRQVPVLRRGVLVFLDDEGGFEPAEKSVA